MALQTFFLEDQVVSDQTAEAFPLRLSADDLRHFKVLRLRAGEHVAVVDASQDYFECEVTDAGAPFPLVRVSTRLDVPPSRGETVLFQGIPKGDKMESVVRHGTELGLAGFVPVAFGRCVSRLDAAKGAKKRERWQAIAKSAAMQSGRVSVPEVSLPLSVDEATALLAGFDRVVVFWEEVEASSGARSVKAALEADEGAEPPQRVAVVVGPEGGIAPAEIDLLVGSGANVRLASLGKSILRTETAGIVGSALVIYELGGLGNEGEGV